MPPSTTRSILRATAGVLVVGATVLGASGCSTASGESTDALLTIANLQDISSFNPRDNSDGYEIQYLQPVYETLTHITSTGEIEPGLATAWEYMDDTNQTLRLTIRADAEFANGDPLDAAAVAASLTRFGADHDSSSSAIEAAAAVDATTVDVTLNTPDPGLLYSFGKTTGMIVDTASSNDELATTPSGSGPYVLVKDDTVAADHYTYERNENYGGDVEYPYDTVVIKPIDDASARLNAVVSGQADVAPADSTTYEEAEAKGLTVTTSDGDTRMFVPVDRAGTVTPFGDVRVRQALNYAVDAQGLLDSVDGGQGTRTTQVFNLQSVAHVDQLDDAYPYDPAKAKELLAEAGYPDGFTLTLPTQPFYPQYSALFEQYLNDVGITVEWVTTTVAEGGTPYTSGEYSAYLSSWGTSDPWVDIKGLVAADGSYNPFGSTDETVAALLDAITHSTGDEQNAKYQELSTYLVEQAWFAPWFVAKNYHVSNDTVKVTAQFGQVVPYLYDYAPAA